MPLFGGAQKPLHGLRVILREVFSVVVAHAHLPLRIRVSLIGDLSQVNHGLRWGATIALVGEIPLARLREAVPAFPTRSEVWLRLLERWSAQTPSA